MLSFLSSGDFDDNFANSLDTDQDRHDVCPDLDPNCLTLIVPVRNLKKNKSYIEKKSTDDNNSMKN